MIVMARCFNCRTHSHVMFLVQSDQMYVLGFEGFSIYDFSEWLA